MDEIFKITQVAQKDIIIIKPLWEELNQIHLIDTVYFQNHYQNFTFDKRVSKFLTKEESNIFVEVISNTNEKPVGYCVSTLDGITGEIDSICINQLYRNKGLGEKLIRNGISWLKSKNCKTIKLGVSYGHESVFGFYEKLGFYPRMTYLELKE
jgi:diamine N-acetyltransferase